MWALPAEVTGHALQFVDVYTALAVREVCTTFCELAMDQLDRRRLPWLLVRGPLVKHQVRLAGCNGGGPGRGSREQGAGLWLDRLVPRPLTRTQPVAPLLLAIHCGGTRDCPLDAVFDWFAPLLTTDPRQQRSTLRELVAAGAKCLSPHALRLARQHFGSLGGRPSDVHRLSTLVREVATAPVTARSTRASVVRRLFRCFDLRGAVLDGGAVDKTLCAAAVRGDVGLLRALNRPCVFRSPGLTESIAVGGPVSAACLDGNTRALAALRRLCWAHDASAAANGVLTGNGGTAALASCIKSRSVACLGMLLRPPFSLDRECVRTTFVTACWDTDDAMALTWLAGRHSALVRVRSTMLAHPRDRVAALESRLAGRPTLSTLGVRSATDRDRDATTLASLDALVMPAWGFTGQDLEPLLPTVLDALAERKAVGVLRRLMLPPWNVSPAAVSRAVTAALGAK